VAIVSDTGFPPSLAVFLSAPNLCDRPPAAPDSATQATLISVIFHAPIIHLPVIHKCCLAHVYLYKAYHSSKLIYFMLISELLC